MAGENRVSVPLTRISRSGPADLTSAGTAPDATDGAYFPNDGHVFLFVDNPDGDPHTLTVVTTQEINGLPVADLPITVADGEKGIFGPFPTRVFNQQQADGALPAPNDAIGKVYVNVDAGGENVLLVALRQ